MNFKDLAIFVYGLFMGTSTGYLKAPRSCYFPLGEVDLGDGLVVQTGGTANCGILASSGQVCLINTSRDSAAAALRSRVNAMAQSGYLFSTSSSEDDFGGLDYFRSFKRVEGDLPNGPGGENVRVMQAGDWRLIYLEKHKTLFTGRLFFNEIHPPFRELARPLDSWRETLENIVASSGAQVVVPGEGAVSDITGVKTFVNYLRDFADHSVDIAVLRERYGQYAEIVGTSSLAENYEFARGITVK